MAFAPRQSIEAPPRRPLPFGLFSVVSLAEAATERWENGVTWENLQCGNELSIVVGDCDDPQGFPKQFPEITGLGVADPFTVYGTYRCSGPEAVKVAQDNAMETLLAGEQKAAERRFWDSIDDSPTILTGGDPLFALAQLEQWIADEYGSLGVIHASRRTAAILAKKARLVEKSGTLYTPLGTPVVAGGGYPGTGTAQNEVQTLGAVDEASGGTFTLTFDGQTTAAIAFDATAGAVQAALEALSNIAPGDVTATAGPLPGTPVTLTFGGAYAGENVPLITVDSTALVDGLYNVEMTTEGGTGTPAEAGEEYIAATGALFGYRSQVFEPTTFDGDLMDRLNNDVFGIAERNYLIGHDDCGVAFIPMTLATEGGFGA